MTDRLKLTLGAAALAFGLMFSAAHAGHHGDKYMKADPAKHAAKLAEKLDLSDAQRADVQQILAEAADERRAIGDSYTLNQRAEAKEAMKALKGRTAERINAVLNAEQQAEFAALQEKQKMRAEHKREQRELARKQREEARGDG